MPGTVKLIDGSVKDELLRFPTVELVRRLFPGLHIKGRSLICNPLRGEKHPSFSCYRDSSGYMKWKDFATGEKGDNIDFYRLVYPEYSYPEAVDRIAFFLLGKSALVDFVPGQGVPFYTEAFSHRRKHIPAKESPSALEIVVATPYGVNTTPKALVDYTRGRGISDEVASYYFSYVVFENLNRKGRSVIDETSGLPVLDSDGSIVKSDGRNESVALINDIGGYSLRVPEGENTKGFKGTNASFPTTILHNGFAPAKSVHFEGNGDGFVDKFYYDERRRFLSVNRTQGFRGVEPWAVRGAALFLDGWSGRYLEGRELRCAVAVLNSLNAPMNRKVTVVEGMFDGASMIELGRMSSGSVIPSTDLVILNSVSNISWAVPFLAMHDEIVSYLDNDMRSSAGEKAFIEMERRVKEFSSRLGLHTVIRSDSASLLPDKDVNDYLKRKKGFRGADVEVKNEEPKQSSRKQPSVRKSRKNSEQKI